MKPITKQPTAMYQMLPSSDFQELEKNPNCQHQHCHCSQEAQAARGRRRRLIILGLVAVLLIGIITMCYMNSCFGWWAENGLGLVKRQAAAPASGNNQDSPFVDRKLYLIVIFVGLFLCLIAAIMLSAWCCKGAFENPLCCPCYLCACCGGLACLECISCGLCAEGLDQM